MTDLRPSSAEAQPDKQACQKPSLIEADEVAVNAVSETIRE